MELKKRNKAGWTESEAKFTIVSGRTASDEETDRERTASETEDEGVRFVTKLWTDKKSYRIGEPVTFYFYAAKDCYLNLINYGTSGKKIGNAHLRWAFGEAVVLMLKAVALVAREVPEVNGFFVDGHYRPATAVHLGVAISLRQGGLVAPALHDVAGKPLEVLMHDLADLVRRARAGSLRSSEMSDPTLTVTNLGDSGVEAVYGVIYPPQVALVGFGRVAERPWVEDGRITVMPALTASLAADHRVSDGHRGAQFLACLRDLLQQPQHL